MTCMMQSLTRIQECAKAVTGDGTELENRVKELCEEDTQGHRESLEKLVSKAERPPGNVRPADCKPV